MSIEEKLSYDELLKGEQYQYDIRRIAIALSKADGNDGSHLESHWRDYEVSAKAAYGVCAKINKDDPKRLRLRPQDD
jgi:hypothetical protein